jgi:hypothetical protein
MDLHGDSVFETDFWKDAATASACEAYLRSLVTELLETVSRAEIVVDDDRSADDGAGDEPRPTA